jgi:DNA polymerase (family 10)/putative hydrolase
LTPTKRWQKYRSFLPTGDWHVHSNYADGESSIAECCRQAETNGLELIAFTEHVRRKLDYSYEEFLEEIGQARDTFQIQILAGCEAKVLSPDGDLDVPDHVLGKCDLVVGSFHSFPYDTSEEYLTAVLNMLKNPQVDIWGHPTLLAQKKGFTLSEADIEQIEQACVENGVLIEENIKYGLPSARFLELTKQAGRVVGSDAHRAADVYDLSRRSK